MFSLQIQTGLFFPLEFDPLTYNQTVKLSLWDYAKLHGKYIWAHRMSLGRAISVSVLERKKVNFNMDVSIYLTTIKQ